MYKKVLLVSDGSRETLVTLREGALIAQAFGARAHLFIIERAYSGQFATEGAVLQQPPTMSASLLDLGLDRLSRLGVRATGEIAIGDPPQLIVRAVNQFRADLVILGHRRKTFLERWWSGSSGIAIVDNVKCSVMIARDTITDEEFESCMRKCAPVPVMRDA